MMEPSDEMYRLGQSPKASNSSNGGSINYRDEDCPKRGVGLSHTQDGMYCRECGVMLVVRGKDAGPFQKAIADSAILSKQARCAYMLCNEKADCRLEVESLDGRVAMVPICFLCREDFYESQRRGLESFVTEEDTLYVSVLT